jgi:enamine deaminase RidA (YjgF/YER057c/UK114 family)
MHDDFREVPEMAKRYIRQFDTSVLNMNTKRIGSRAIRARGDLVFFQGQMGFDLDGKFVGHGDPGEQAEQACKNIKTLIEEAGGTIEDICKLTIYITDASYRPAVYAVIDRYFATAHHCSTGVVVRGLATPDLLVEIDAFGAIDEPNG